MKLTSTGLAGAWVVEYTPACDDRGGFTELWEPAAFADQGLLSDIDQVSSAYNLRANTLRGMHLQNAPFAQTKIVSCTAGAIYDVIIDLRPGSPSYKRWFNVELHASMPCAVYIPAGFAHGYLTLKDNSTVHYLIGGKYSPGHARGVRWNDPAFGIRWPAEPAIIAPRDAQFPDLTE